jgi:hypothetical protein
MDTNFFTCMEAAGIITESQRARLTQLARSLPETDNGLLSVIAASLLMGDAESYHGTPISTQNIASTGIGDVKSLTVPTGATTALITVHDNNIIFRTDGGTPADNTGHIALANANFSVGSLSDFKFASASGTANLFVSYF